MEKQRDCVVLTLISPAEKKWRFYRLQVLPGGQVLQQWGRIGGAHQELLKAFDSEALAAEHYDRQLAAKIKEGYQVSDQTELPTGKESECPWCALGGPVRRSGMVAVPYPSHTTRSAQDMATRARWLAQVDHLSGLMGEPDVLLSAGPHAVAYLLGELPAGQVLPGQKEEPPAPGGHRQLGLFD